jgi:hypothetical protein
MQVGDLVRFKLDKRERPGNARELYPYKFEIGIVVPGPSPCHNLSFLVYVVFPSQPVPITYIEMFLEVLNESR